MLLVFPARITNPPPNLPHFSGVYSLIFDLVYNKLISRLILGFPIYLKTMLSFARKLFQGTTSSNCEAPPLTNESSIRKYFEAAAPAAAPAAPEEKEEARKSNVHVNSRPQSNGLSSVEELELRKLREASYVS